MFGNHRTGQAFIALVAVALLGPSFAGCVQGGAGSGTGAIYVKDAPEDEFSHVNVTFTSVRVHRGGNDTGEWVTVAENATGREVDLLAFSGADARALLGASELPAGTYNQVLINVSDAYGIDKDSGDRVDFTLTRPQLRLTRAWQIEENQTTHVIADLNLDRSIVRQGQGQYRFNPVIGQVIVESGGEPSSRRDAAAGGGSGGAQANGTQQGSMTTYVKDAPTDEFEEIWITFAEVRVHYAGNGSEANATGNETNGTDEGRWLTAFNGTRSVDLLRFNETGAKAFLGAADVPVGRYTQIRVNVTEAYGIDENGTRSNITVSSGTAKIVRPWTVSANGTTAQVTIDLNLDRSLHKQGGGSAQGQGQGQGQADGDRQTSWRLTPVIGKVLVDHVEDDPREDLPDQAQA